MLSIFDLETEAGGSEIESDWNWREGLNFQDNVISFHSYTTWILLEANILEANNLSGFTCS